MTYKRPQSLRDSLARIAEQTHPPDRLVVVDNGSDEGVRTAAIAAGAHYIDAGDNLGPAGGIALGMDYVIERAGESDWLVLFDDDDPPVRTKDLEDLVQYGEACLADNPRTAAVGLVGAVYDYRRGMVARIPDRDLKGRVSVDYIGGGQLPIYRSAVLKDVGVFDRSLFFGFDDLEHGLRLKRAGYDLYVDGTQWLARRSSSGRAGLDAPPKTSIETLAWRRYYSIRNTGLIAREYASRAAFWRTVLRGGLGSWYMILKSGQGLRASFMAVRGIRDAVRGAGGRQVQPESAKTMTGSVSA